MPRRRSPAPAAALAQTSATDAARDRRRWARRALRAAPPSSAQRRICRSSRRRGSRRNGAAACLRLRSACASARGRASSRAAPTLRGRPRRRRPSPRTSDAGSLSELLELGAVALELLPLLLDELLGSLLRETLVRQLALRSLDL